MGPKGHGIELHGCTTLGAQTCDLLKMELLAIVQCTAYADVGMVLCNNTFLKFFLDLFSVLSLFRCVFVYVCISVSLSFISPSLWKSLCLQITVVFPYF